MGAVSCFGQPPAGFKSQAAVHPHGSPWLMDGVRVVCASRDIDTVADRAVVLSLQRPSALTSRQVRHTQPPIRETPNPTWNPSCWDVFKDQKS